MIQIKKDHFNIIVLKIGNVGYLETIVFTNRVLILRQQKYLNFKDYNDNVYVWFHF